MLLDIVKMQISKILKFIFVMPLLGDFNVANIFIWLIEREGIDFTDFSLEIGQSIVCGYDLSI